MGSCTTSRACGFKQKTILFFQKLFGEMVQFDEHMFQIGDAKEELCVL